MLTALNLDQVFKRALQNGGEFAEAFYENTTSNQLFYEDRRLDRISSGIDSGVGLRVIYGTQSVYGYTTELTQAGLLELAETLSKVVAGKLAGGGAIAFTKVKPSFSYKIEKDPMGLTLKQKLGYVDRANGAAWKASKDIKQVTAGYVETLRKIEIANSLGQLATDEKQYLTFYTEVVGERDGQTQTSYEVQGGFSGLELFDEHSPESIAGEAARRLDVLLSAKPAPSGTMPVVLAAEAGGTMVHEAVGHGLEADLACNGLSVYGNKLGEQVASPLITIVDDGTIPAKRGSFSVDDEGTASRKNVLIDKGILKAYMADRLSHIKFGVPLTGNGRRESYRHKPIVRMTNTYIERGRDRPEDILGNTKMGLYVKSMGGGQVNTVTGDFVFAVTEGYLIIDGEMGPPVKGATLTGNGPDIMRRVDRVGTDLGYAMGTCGKDGQGAPVTDAQPTIRIPEITVGGETPLSTYWPSAK
ncbi:MAG: TldD/PmbA family protein [Deltaproteobacteria bacterium]|nr:TldD/PmbA family protein [Deltaproteobacteria bacterium]